MSTPLSVERSATWPAAPVTPVMPLPVSVLAMFRRQMAYEGLDVDLLRLCSDPAYAQACLATAHTSSRETLRQMAVQLFESHQRNASPV